MRECYFGLLIESEWFAMLCTAKVRQLHIGRGSGLRYLLQVLGVQVEPTCKSSGMHCLRLCCTAAEHLCALQGNLEWCFKASRLTSTAVCSSVACSACRPCSCSSSGSRLLQLAAAERVCYGTAMSCAVNAQLYQLTPNSSTACHMLHVYLQYWLLPGTGKLYA